MTTTSSKTLRILIPLRPVPCPRPRFAGGRAYYPKNYNEWRDAALTHIPAVNPLYDGALDVLVFVALPPFKTVVRDWPRGDVDNYAKSTLDVITKSGTVWVDDVQVVRLAVEKFFTADEPCTSVHIKPYTGLIH